MKFKWSQYNIVVKKDCSETFLYNAFSGSFCKIQNDVCEKMQAGYSEGDIHFAELLEQGLIVPYSLDEFGRMMYVQNSHMWGSSKTMRFVIAPTLSCNLKCIYCFERECSRGGDVSKTRTMSQATMEHTFRFIISQLQNSPDVKKLSINWFGGEPLMVTEKIVWLSEQLIQYCNQAGIEYSSFMITNGALLSREVADTLKSKCRIDKLQLTIDGTDAFYARYKSAKQDALRKLIDHIEYASQLFKIDIRMNTSEENREAIIEISRELMLNKNILPSVTIYPAQIVDCDQPNCHSLSDLEFEMFRRRFEAELKPFRSDNGSKSIARSKRAVFCASMKKGHYVIGPDGEIYKCERELGNKNQVVGDVVYGLYHNYAEMQYSQTSYELECRQCAFFPFCFGGCPTYRIVYGEQADCNAMRSRILDKLEHEFLGAAYKVDLK